MLNYWQFYLGAYLMINGIAWFVLYGHYKRRRREKAQIEILIRKRRSISVAGYRPCLYENGVWHEGVCKDIGCPSLTNKPTVGAPRYANSNR